MKSSYKRVLMSEEFIFTAILFLAFLILFLYTLSWPFRAGLSPKFVCGLIMVLSAREMVMLFLKSRGELAPAEKSRGRIPWQVIAGFATLGAIVPLGYALGLAPATGIMAAVLAALYGERKWWVIILVGVTSYLLMYFLFGKVFALPLEFF